MDIKDIKKIKLYSIKEVAQFIGVSRITLYKMIHGGKIKAINIANSGKKAIFAFHPNDIQDYYDSIQDSSGVPPEIREEKESKNIHK